MSSTAARSTDVSTDADVAVENRPESAEGAESAVLLRLREELGEAVTTEGPAFEAAHTDKSGWTAEGRALALVRARSIADVQATLRLAS